MAVSTYPPLAGCPRAVDAVGDTTLHEAARDLAVADLSIVYAADPAAAAVRNTRGQPPVLHVMIGLRPEASFSEALGAPSSRASRDRARELGCGEIHGVCFIKEINNSD